MKSMRKQTDESGFTIVEMYVVVIIIGILTAIAIPSYLAHRKSSWNATVQSDVSNTAIFIEQNKMELGGYLSYPDAPPGAVISDNVKLKVYGTAQTKTKGSCIEAYYTASPSDTVWSYEVYNRKMSQGPCVIP